MVIDLETGFASTPRISLATGRIETARRWIAQAAIDPTLWPEAFWHVSQIMGSDMTLCEQFSNTNGQSRMGFCDNPKLAAQMRASYESHYSLISPRWQLQQHLPCGALAHDDLIGGEAALDRTEFYSDFLPVHGLRYFVGVEVVCDSEHALVVSLQRTHDRGRFGADDLQLFSRLLPDLRNALALSHRLSANSGVPLPEVFDRLADPVAVIEEDGRLHFANRAMAALIAAGDIVHLRKRWLAGSSPAAARALARCLRCSAEASVRGLSTERVGALSFRAVELDDEAGAHFTPGKRLFCLLIDDPHRPRWDAVDLTMRLLALTRREATIGLRLVEGEGTDEIARNLGVSRNTVRTHLAMLREKLGVRSTLAVAAAIRRATGPYH